MISHGSKNNVFREGRILFDAREITAREERDYGEGVMEEAVSKTSLLNGPRWLYTDLVL